MQHEGGGVLSLGKRDRKQMMTSRPTGCEYLKDGHFRGAPLKNQASAKVRLKLIGCRFGIASRRPQREKNLFESYLIFNVRENGLGTNHAEQYAGRKATNVGRGGEYRPKIEEVWGIIHKPTF